MWSSILLTDPSAPDSSWFSGVNVLPLRDSSVLLDAIAKVESEWLVVAVPAALATSAAPAIALAAGRWPRLSIAWFVTPQAPLAILSALAGAKLVTDHPAYGADLAQRLLDHSWSGAWVTSLSRLSRPAPTLRQHVRSLLPGSQFLVRHHPSPAVVSGAAAFDVPAVPIRRVLLAQDGAIPPAVVSRFAQAPGVDAVRQVGVPGTWRSVYGTQSAGQLAIVPADAYEFIGTVTGHCRTCGLELTSNLCPFCRIVPHGQRLSHPVVSPVASFGAGPVQTAPIPRLGAR